MADLYHDWSDSSGLAVLSSAPGFAVYKLSQRLRVYFPEL
jgi:hypothetical protein